MEALKINGNSVKCSIIFIRDSTHYPTYKEGSKGMTCFECQYVPGMLLSHSYQPSECEDPCIINYILQSTSIKIRWLFLLCSPLSAPRWGIKRISVTICTTDARLPNLAETCLCFPNLPNFQSQGYIATSSLCTENPVSHL